MLEQTDIRSYYKQLGSFNYSEHNLSPNTFLLVSLQKHDSQQSPSHLPRKPSFESQKHAHLQQLKSQFSPSISIEELKQLCITFLKTLDSQPPSAPPLYSIHIATNEQNLTMHWGVAVNRRNEWKEPSKEQWPKGTKEFGDGKAIQTLLQKDPVFDNTWSIQINIIDESIIGINFVLVDKTRNCWFNNNNQNFCLPFVKKMLRSRSQLPQVTMELIIEQIIEAETQYGSWTLMHRYNKCIEFLNQIDIKNIQNLSWLFIWLRYSQNRLLDWQRNYNTKPRELQGSQNNITQVIVTKWSQLDSNQTDNFFQSKDLLRMMLGCVGKGNANGQAIRDEILHIMHRHHIKETKDHFYEEWHQKLHNNTTPDDIVICEAVIEFLKTNSLRNYWAHLTANGITRERLASFDRAITMEPHYMPQMLNDFQNYLGILKAVHSANDIELMAGQAMNHLGDIKGLMEEILWKRDDIDVLQQIRRITRFRRDLEKKIEGAKQNIQVLRDLLFLDNALEHYLRSQIEKILHFKLSFENYSEELSLILQNLTFSIKWKELNACSSEWDQFVLPISKDLHKQNNALRMKAICERIKNCLGTVVDNMTDTLQPSATFLGTQCRLPNEYIDLFTEEVIRGSLFFAVSMVMKKIDEFIIQVLGQADWLIISPLEQCSGILEFTQSLRQVQTVTYQQSTVIITEKVLGDEEIPENVKAVILVNSPTYPDVLSHVSVRARNWFFSFFIIFLQSKALFCVCLNYEIGKKLFDLTNQYVSIKQAGSNVEFNTITEEQLQENDLQDESTSKKQEVFIPKEPLKEYFVKPSEFTKENVGAKSNNLEKIRGKISSWIKLPIGMTIPFNGFEEILDLPENEAVQQQLEDQLRDIIQQKITNPEQLANRLSKCQSLVMQMNFPIEQKGKNLKLALEEFGITDIKKGWRAIKRVMASKFNERAYISTKKIGITLDQIRMAVLIQPIISAEYAFVIHTKHPITNNPDEIYCEVVKGLGETLVGAYKGQSFSFTVQKQSLQCIVNSFMSKSVMLQSSGFMFRSDSNTEDLENFAGAGLFDSFPSEDVITEIAFYAKDKLMVDSKFQEEFMKKIAEIAMEIEKVYQKPQDIEGCYFKGEYYVVQTRPQV